MGTSPSNSQLALEGAKRETARAQNGAEHMQRQLDLQHSDAQERAAAADAAAEGERLEGEQRAAAAAAEQDAMLEVLSAEMGAAERQASEAHAAVEAMSRRHERFVKEAALEAEVARARARGEATVGKLRTAGLENKVHEREREVRRHAPIAQLRRYSAYCTAATLQCHCTPRAAARTANSPMLEPTAHSPQPTAHSPHHAPRLLTAAEPT